MSKIDPLMFSFGLLLGVILGLFIDNVAFGILLGLAAGIGLSHLKPTSRGS